MALGLAHELVREGAAEEVPKWSMRFVTAYDLMAQLSGYRDRETRFKQYLGCSLLFLDDLGREPAWDTNASNLTKVVMHRYNYQLPMIVTSNLSFGEIGQRRGRNGDAVTGRLREMARGSYSKVLANSQQKRKRKRSVQMMRAPAAISRWTIKNLVTGGPN
jgi:DNA replication protein DnaC